MRAELTHAPISCESEHKDERAARAWRALDCDGGARYAMPGTDASYDLPDDLCTDDWYAPTGRTVLTCAMLPDDGLGREYSPPASAPLPD
eukprot:2093341-Rhodomonas_salina.1